MKTIDEIMLVVDTACDAYFEQGLNRRVLDEEPEKARAAVVAALREALTERKPIDLLVITTAYEQGVGKGIKRDNFNPYKEDTDAHAAWRLGYDEGLSKSYPTE